jgi:release factor glutamine methyltransferase
MTSSAPERSTTESWTIDKVLRWATDDFRARGHDTPRLEAELLLCHAIGLDRVRLIVESQRPLAPTELGTYRDLIKRRRAREPVAYILGQREFFGLPFRVDSRVLIPRPDTETLVEVALDRTRRRDMFGNMLDLCTGSGCVAIAFAKKRPTWRVTGVDVSEGAVDVARDNALRLGAAFNTHFTVGDLVAPLPAGARFDLVTANPPYIPSAEMKELAPDILGYEPGIALEGGSDGLDLIRRIVDQVVPLLADDGVLALEVHYDQGDAVAALLAAAGLADIDKRKDYGGHERVVSGRATGRCRE